MKVLFFAVLAISTALALEESQEKPPSWVYEAFDAWCEKYDQKFDSPSEREYRVGVFYKNLQEIEKTNAEQDDYKLGLNQFSAMTPEEFSASRNMGLRYSRPPEEETLKEQREI
jgi:hypothetical protein